MTPSTNSKTAQIQVSRPIRDDRLNNGADHAAVIALCANCKQSEGQTKNLCSPFCDPSCLVSSTLQLEARFWKQNSIIIPLSQCYNTIKKTEDVDIKKKGKTRLTLRGSSAGHMSARRHWSCYRLACWKKHSTVNGLYIIMEANLSADRRLTSWQ